jgi:diguanylate cyclase (GGDEF)-like protein
VSVENWCDLRFARRRAYLAIDAGPVFDAEGRLHAVVETVRDITAQKEAQDSLARLAALDGLTGLANRRTFDEALESEARRCAREGVPLSLLMMDIDHSKSFNDHFGRCGGDACLRRVAGAITGAVLRPGDLVARYGGEEFAVILPDTDLSGARATAERLRGAVAELAIGYATAAAGGVTMSVGGATGVKVDSEDLLAIADAALYRSKCGGRDTVNVVAAGGLAGRL